MKRQSGGGGEAEQIIARFNPDGSLDTAFGARGFVTNETSTSAQSLALIGNDILAVGQAPLVFPPDGRDIVISRYNPDGSPASDFGDQGIVRLDTNDSSDDSQRSRTIRVRDGSQILVIGENYGVKNGLGTLDTFVAHFTNTGERDSTIGDNGVVFLNRPDLLSPASDAAVFLPNQDLIVAMTVVTGFNFNIGFASIRTDGTLNPAVTPPGSPMPVVVVDDVISDNNDNVLVLGTTVNSNGRTALAITKLGPTGDYLLDFNGHASLTATVNLGLDTSVTPRAFEEQDDGKIVVAAIAKTADDRYLTLLRFLPDGRIDESFGERGITSLPNDDGIQISDVAIGKAGQIIVNGYDQDPGDILLWGFDANGKPNQSFGSSGLVRRTSPRV